MLPWPKRFRLTERSPAWLETYSSPNAWWDIGMVVGGEFAWVAYANSSERNIVRMRRFHVATGMLDSTYAEVVVNLSPDSVSEIAMTSNIDDGDTAIYVGIMAVGNVHTYRDDLGGTSFDAMPAPVAGDVIGVDLAMNIHGLGASGYLWLLPGLEFIPATGFQVKVWRLTLLSAWDEAISVQLPPTLDPTSTAISAFEDTIMVAAPA
jgi:hypothetical protein